MIRRLLSLVFAVLFLMQPGSVLAVEPDEMLKDPKLEARAREISKNLRCLVCQNQSIDDSNADLAKDLRLLVRERLTKGDSNEQAMQYIVDRYGEFVLLRPLLNMHTVFLWLGPLLMLLFAAGYIYMNWSKRGSGSTDGPKVEALSSAEKERLQKLMDGD